MHGYGIGYEAVGAGIARQEAFAYARGLVSVTSAGWERGERTVEPQSRAGGP